MVTTFKKFVVLFFFANFLLGCSTTPIAYNPKQMPIKEAKVLVEQLIMTQNHKWRPDNFIITENYLGWYFGEIARSSETFTGMNTKFTAANERIYFNRIEDVRLYRWRRSYIISLLDKSGHRIKMNRMAYILRTKSREDAELMFDAITTLLKSKNTQP